MKAKLRQSLFVMLLMIAALAFSTPAWAASGSPIVVTMGDSYAAGEGIQPFFGQDSQDKYWNQDWIARRSQTGWSTQLVSHGISLKSIRAVPGLKRVQNGETLLFDYTSWSEGTWFNVANSTAWVEHVYGGNADGQGYLSKKIYKTGTPYGTVSYTAVYAPQIQIFDYIDQKFGKNSVDYVLLSMGGNDIGFVDIMVKAATSSNDLDETLDGVRATFTGTTRNEVAQALKAIRAAAGPQATIIIVGYPIIFDGAKTNLLFSKAEMEQINGVAQWLDQQYASLIDELVAGGFKGLYYVSLAEPFKGHGAYSSDPYIGSISFGDDEACDDNSTLAYINGSSLHPNQKGANAIAQEVQKLIDRLEGTHASGWANENGGWYYYDNNGNLCKNAWVQTGGAWYYLGSSGAMLANAWVKSGGAWYYLGSDGRMAANAWVKSGGAWYYLGSSGAMLANAWVKSGSAWYYLGSDGKMAANAWVKSAGAWYYLGSDGKMVANAWIKYNGKYYHFNGSGACDRAA